jgi:hypothetical protein
MRKTLFVLALVCVAVIGAAALASDVQGGNVCPPGYKKIRCVSGRIVCCAHHDACDCGPGIR